MTHHAMLPLLFVCFIMMTQYAATSPARRSHKQKCLRWIEYFNQESGKCEECSACGKGLGLVSSCTRKRDTICERCEPGVTFLPARHRRGSPCYACRQCNGRAIDKPCTPTSDTVCGECPLGTYWDGIWDQCQPCSYCYDGHARLHGSMVNSCMKVEIPTSYWCAYVRSPPYPAPKLISTKLANGTILFYTAGSKPLFGHAEKSSTSLHREGRESSLDNLSSTTTLITASTTQSTTSTSGTTSPITTASATLADESLVITEKDIFEQSNYDEEGSGGWLWDDEDFGKEVLEYVKQDESFDIAEGKENGNSVLVISMSMMGLCLFIIISVICCALYKQSKQDHNTVYKPIYNPQNVRATPRTNRADLGR